MPEPAQPTSPAAASDALGAILAGGASRRLGSPKALAMVGGVSIVQRVRAAVQAVVGRTVLIANQPGLFAEVGLNSRPDLSPGAGPVAGVQAALRWADDEGLAGALIVACDLPFVHPDALRLIVEGGRRAHPPADAVAVRLDAGEAAPLCTWMAVRALPAVERAVGGDDRSLGTLFSAIRTHWIRVQEFTPIRDPHTLFFNVNTPDDLRMAERLARELDARA
jgi:molybdenum cofactor guanylyltransferase